MFGASCFQAFLCNLESQAYFSVSFFKQKLISSPDNESVRALAFFPKYTETCDRDVRVDNAGSLRLAV